MERASCVFEQTKERYYRLPRLSLGSDGNVRLFVVVWEGDEEQLVRYDLGADLSPRVPPLILYRDCAIQNIESWWENGEESFRVTKDPASEDTARSRLHRAWIKREHGKAELWAQRLDAAAVCVFRATGIVAAPSITETNQGAWIAFHHNLREDSCEPDIAKWVALRFLGHDGQVWEPGSEMVGRDRDRSGEEQSLEFPQLVAGSDGAFSVLARGSHQFWRQDLRKSGFGERIPIGSGEWGCRGRRFVGVCRADGTMVTARRERRGIVVDAFMQPEGGPPELKITNVEWSPRPTVLVPQEIRRRDFSRNGEAIFFGDIHQHSAHSDGIGTADEAYLRARDLQGDDFCALTDHESFLGKRTGPGEWQYLQSVADRYNDPGRFATLFAYEWTGKMHPGPGHKVVYLPHGSLPLISRDEISDGKELVTRVKELGGFAVPHHVGWTGANEQAHDDEGQPVWEICSCHGCYEYAGHPLGQRGELRDQQVDSMLRKGLRFGFIACSDSHGLLWHHGVGRKRDPFRTGLTAVQASACTREGILQAIRQRRCYATSGGKILLEFTINDVPMGGVLRGGPEATATVRVQGTAPLRRLTFVNSGADITFSGFEGASFIERSTRVQGGYCYVRVEQEDGEMAWSSPVFVEL